MAKIKYIIPLFAALTLFACKKDDDKDTPKPEPEPEPEVVIDTIAPKLVSSTPTEGAKDVPVSGKIVVTFDEDVKFAVENPDCYVGYGLGLSIKLNPVIEGNTITCEYQNLMEGYEYYFRIAAEHLSDLEGNVNKEAYQVGFTTEDITAPTFVGSSPKVNATDAPLCGKIILVFDQDVKIAGENPDCYIGYDQDHSTKVTPKANGKIVTIEYSGLENNRDYFCRIASNVISDVAGNAINSVTQVAFKTVEASSNSFVANTTVLLNDNFYNGLKLQMGYLGSTDVIAEATIGNGGKAVFNTDLTQFADKDVWFCVPKIAKFFHHFSSSEAAAGAVNLPDKDFGSTVDASGYHNDWIIALYMGIDNADNKPLYWATGNLIAVKTNGAGSKSEVAYHIATDEETDEEGTANNSFVMMNDKLVANVKDGYAALPAGSKWDMFSFGDPTGLCLYLEANIDQYCIDLGQMAADKTNIVFEISGDERFDAARAQLGGLWRLPTGGQKTINELAAFEDSVEEYASIAPDGKPAGSPMSKFGMDYNYAVSGTGNYSVSNTLKLPAGGYRHATEAAAGSGMFCLYWSGNADPTGTPGYEAVEGGHGEAVDKTGQTVDVWNTAYGYGFINREKKWFIHPRTSSQCIRPVTE